jgi:hypothetical protein
MGSLNEKRLYWVWSSVLLKTVLELVPPDFFNTDQAKQTVKTPDPYTGCLSWVLYYFRFALNLGLLLKHTISGPWMSEEEKKIPWTERFQTQWAQRKFTLLNDSLWATANMVSFFWLNGKGALGTYGDLLTIALLVFDISVAVWDFEEQKTKYNKEMLDYNLNIKDLKNEIYLAKLAYENRLADLKLHMGKYTNKNIPDYETKINKLKNQINIEETKYNRIKSKFELELVVIQRAQKKCQREWDYSKLTLINNIAYAVGLMLAFVLLTTPFMPIAAGALAAIGVAGAVLCFAFTVIYNAVKGGMEIHKAQMSAKEAEQEYKEKITQFNKLKDEQVNEKKLLFLEIKQLHAETEYQKKLVVLQTMHLVRSVLFEALIPAIIFVSMVFLPLGIGFAVLGAVVALAILSNLAINAKFKPEKEKLTEFNKQEYENFFIYTQDKDNSSKSLTFFKPGEKPTIAKIPPVADETDNDLYDTSLLYRNNPQPE